MSDTDEFARLATDEHQKRQRYEYLGMCNRPTDPVDAAKSRAEFMRAEAEWWAAQCALRDAQRKMAGIA